MAIRIGAIRIGIAGITGRMGHLLVEEVSAADFETRDDGRGTGSSKTRPQPPTRGTLFFVQIPWDRAGPAAGIEKGGGREQGWPRPCCALVIRGIALSEKVRTMRFRRSFRKMSS